MGDGCGVAACLGWRCVRERGGLDGVDGVGSGGGWGLGVRGFVCWEGMVGGGCGRVGWVDLWVKGRAFGVWRFRSRGTGIDVFNEYVDN